MARPVFRYWRHWDAWLPDFSRMSVRGYRLRATHGVRQGFPYVALLYIPAGQRRATWKLIPDSYGVTLWHRAQPSGPFHRHGTIGWGHRPGLTWAARLRSGVDCPAVSSAS